jgi:hypothetical protein
MMSFRHAGPPLLLLLASCGSNKSAPRSIDTASPPKPPAVHAPFGEPEEDAPWPLSAEAEEDAKVAQTARAIDRALCPDSPCCVTELQEAGRDRKGQDLFVVALSGDGPCLAPPPPPPPGPFGAGILDRARAPGRRAKIRAAAERARAAQADSDGENTDRRDCTPADYHFVVRKGGHVRDVALLTHSCGIPTDFPEPGDTVAVDKEKKLVTQFGGSGSGLWGDYSVSLGLDPLHMVKIETSSFHRSSPNDVKARSWDWESFAGTSQWFAIDCKKKAQQEANRHQREAGAGNDDDNEEPTFNIDSVLIPEVELPADFVATDWRTTGLGGCSAALNHSIFGDPGRSEASASVVVSGNTLFVEVTDDRFVGPGKNWIKDDHLELWMGSAGSEYSRCVGEDDKGSVAQWGIRVADGEVFPAHGAPQPLTGIERVVMKHKARFKIPLPRMGDRITVVYSDSDDGQRQKHLMATSQLRFGDPATLGETFSTGCGCIVKKGALQPKCGALVPESGSALMEGRL